MILSPITALTHLIGKPRASGDDPAFRAVADGDPVVNPARAGMILLLV